MYSGDRVGQMKTMGSSHAKRVDAVFDEVCVELRKLLVGCFTKDVQFWRCFGFHDVFHIIVKHNHFPFSIFDICLLLPLASLCFEPSCV